MAVSDAWRRRIEQGFQRNLADWPLVRRELAALLPALSEEEALCLRAVYAGLGPQDLASIPAGQHLEDVRTALLARRELDRQVGEELFFLYVLPARVNNEFPDGARPWLYEQLRDRVKGLGLAETALEVNYWCYAHATYAPADDRTLGPRGVCSRARGRCGEESTLLTAALRAVGVPARQVYAPRWAHCDDNHAWVEIWDGTGWRYMGACEPEEAPDRGWFTSAASRSMLVRALEPDAVTFCEKAKEQELLLVPADDFGCPGYVRIAYCVTTEQIGQTHEPDAWQRLPDCTAVEDNYYRREGAYLEDANPQRIGEIFARAQEGNAGIVRMQCADDPVYEEVYRFLILEQGIFSYLPDTAGSVAYADNPGQRTLCFWLEP